MNKTKSKVLSLILASAMIVSSFSSLNFASAASRTENGTVSISGDDEIYLVSDPNAPSELYGIEKFIGTGTVETYDNEEVSGEEVTKISHVSGDKLLKFDDDQISVKKDVSGEEVIRVTWEGDGERDEKDTTVKATKDITVHVDVDGKLFPAKAGDLDDGTERPGDIPTAAVNEQYLKIGVYYADRASDDEKSSDYIVAKYNNSPSLVDLGYFTVKDDVVTPVDAYIELDDDDVFTDIGVESTTSSTITLKTTFEGAGTGDDADKDDAELADTGKDTLTMNLGQYDDKANIAKWDDTDFTVTVAKKWNADVSLTDGVSSAGTSWEINKHSGKTYLAPATLNIDWDDRDEWSDNDYADHMNVNSIGSYDLIVSEGIVDVLGGSIGDLEEIGRAHV